MGEEGQSKGWKRWGKSSETAIRNFSHIRAFSASTKRVFKAAVEYSRTIGYNFITPEHIAIRLFTFDDGSADCVFKRQCCSRPSARKIWSLASNCSSTNSSWKSIMVNDDTKPCISSAANKLNLRKNSCSRVVHFNYNDNLKMVNEYGIKDTLENKEFENLSLIRRQLVQIEN